MEKHIVLGISGGIAAYKIPEMIRLLIRDNFLVQCVLTDNALNFVTKYTIATISQRQPLNEQFIDTKKSLHLDLSKTGDLLVIAPATANIIAKCAHGIADDLLSTLFLSFQGPKLIIPAMHTQMYLNPATQENIAKLKQRDVHFLGPDIGDLACGDKGIGRMVNIELIIEKIKSLFLPQLNLKGQKILVTAGGTKEAIDAVRMITNRSSGKLGYAIANVAAFAGADVTLITTNKQQTPNCEIKKTIYVDTAHEMAQAVQKEIIHNDYLFMAAAVADFTCKKSETKLKRINNLQLNLSGTEDILKSITPLKKNKTYVGFCLEDNNLKESAQKKLTEKNLDYIVANTSNNIGSDTRTAFLLSAKSNEIIHFKDQTPFELASALLQQVTKLAR
jgi:phosphopantothenoylcysteine decarboxylase/phosphopantothenate--cysteine ligase